MADATLTDSIPAGAMPILVIGRNHIVGPYCCPFGSKYGFGDGFDWYLYPGDPDYIDARQWREGILK